MTKGSAALQTTASCIGPGHTFPPLGRGALFCQLSSSGALGFSHTGHLGLLLAQNCAKAGCGLPGPPLRLQGQTPLLVPSRCSVNVRQTSTPARLELRVRWMVVSAKGERAGSGTGTAGPEGPGFLQDRRPEPVPCSAKVQKAGGSKAKPFPWKPGIPSPCLSQGSSRQWQGHLQPQPGGPFCLLSEPPLPNSVSALASPGPHALDLPSVTLDLPSVTLDPH